MTRAMAILLALAVAGFAIQTLRLERLRTSVAEQRAAQAEADRLHDRAASHRTQETDRATQTRINAARAAAAAARTDADLLRDALAPYAQPTASTPSCAAESAASARLASLVEQAAGLVAECQERGADLATQVIGLQEHALGQNK
jgi:hypothetical protein